MTHPAQLGKYQITAVLGEGAMGVVYKGFDPDIRRPVALKTIRRQLMNDSAAASTAAARFRNEAQAAGRLSHPGIVGVYDYGEDRDVAFIAMEFVEGQSVSRYLASGLRFTDEDIAGLMSQLLDALGHAHDQGVWHRDIKPANVMLSRGGRLKVADFGIARVDNSGLTQTQVMVGTPAYMAPEQFRGGAIDARVDLYAAGVLMYVLLAGQAPYGGSPEQILYKLVHETPAPPSTLAAQPRNPAFDAVVAQAMAKEADARYATAAAFKAAVLAALGQPVDATAWEQTLVNARLRPAADDRPVTGSSLGSAARHWDPATLSQAERTLAEFVGPMAALLVRRAARESDSLAALYTRLADQVADPALRQAFVDRVSRSGQSTAGGGAGNGSGGVATTTAPPAQLSEALLQRAERLLAMHLGPIAKVVVKKAAAQSRERAGFLARVGDAVADPRAREALLAALERVD